MNYFLFFLFLVSVVSKKFLLKFINTPIYKSIPISLFHSVILLENNNINNPNSEENTFFAIDFCPIEDIGSPNVILKLLQGQNIQGKIRVFSFSKEFYKTISKEPLTNNLYSKETTIFESFNPQLSNENMRKLENIDSQLVLIIKSWGSSFQIYNRNCRHFSNFIKKHY